MSYRTVLTELWKCSYSTFEDDCQWYCDCAKNTSDVSMDCFALPTCIYSCIKSKKRTTKTKSIDLKNVWKWWQSYIHCNETVSQYTEHTLDLKLKIKLVQFTQKKRCRYVNIGGIRSYQYWFVVLWLTILCQLCFAM